MQIKIIRRQWRAFSIENNVISPENEQINYKITFYNFYLLAGFMPNETDSDIFFNISISSSDPINTSINDS